MSFATRCTACGTIFRVVQDQLRVSEGWVRCGRCAEVFDARLQLVDIDRDASPPWPMPMPNSTGNSDNTDIDEIGPAEEAQAEAGSTADFGQRSAWPSSHERTRQPGSGLSHSDELEFETAALPRGQTRQEPTPEPLQHPASGFQDAENQVAYPADTRLEPQWMKLQAHAAAPVEISIAAIHQHAADSSSLLERARAEPPSIDPLPTASTEFSKASQSASTAAIQAPTEPSFMRRGSKENRWQKPGMHVALNLSSVFLLALLSLQVSHHFHNAIAALYPAAKPMLQRLCQVSACQIQPWQRIAAVHVESSNLSQTATSNHYRLTVTLRNKSAVDVATPWIELSLTDASGALVARRMLAPKELNATTSTVLLGTELPLQAVLATGEQRISGYSVEVFHP